MNASRSMLPDQKRSQLTRCARVAGLRALAWNGDVLHASGGYELLRAQITDPSNLNWQPVAAFRPDWKRRLSVTNRLSARLFRDGFHALAVLPSQRLVAAVPGSIVALLPGETEFRQTHTITRGTRPLPITADPGSQVYRGEYFDNASREEIHDSTPTDDGFAWSVAYAFPKGAI